MRTQGSRRGNTNRTHSFTVAPTVSMPRSTFPTPSRTTSTIDAGFIYPMFVDLDVLPGDTYRFKQKCFGRLATPLKPFMDNLWLDTHVFFTPYRILYENWEQLQGAREDPDSSVDFEVPQISIANGSALNLADYFGLPVATLSAAKEVSALPFRAYNKIWNEFYRDQDVSDSLVEDITSANSTEANHVLKRRMKRKDYLTSCRPSPQKGTAVSLPLGTRANVVGIGAINQVYTTGTSAVYETGASATVDYTLGFKTVDGNGVNSDFRIEEDPANAGFPNIYADLTNATATTLAAFRSAVSLQQILELDARAGTRTPELLKARWGVTSADARLQRPEYICGGSQNISVTPVPVSSEASTGAAGDVAGYGTSYGETSCTHSFTEHGVLMALVSIRADMMYYAGVHKMWRREGRHDHYEPAMAHLSEQAVLTEEVYCLGTAGDSTVFGYQERWSEYKYGKSMCTGLMRPAATGTLAQWNLAQELSGIPTLSETYLQEDPPVDRVIVVDTEPHFLIDCWYENSITRVMPVHNTPGLTRL